jgi:cyclopropane-fatty-acyl-phospholipid synthase
MRIVRPAAFFHRLGCNSKIGFGESYMVGDWTATELADLLTPFAARLSVLIPPLLQRIGRRSAEARQPREERNTVEGSRENIHRHYDLSNELFATFLDETMSYSSGWFDHPEETLADAQRRKIDGILDMAHVGPDTHVLEIGTGWGGLATRAAQRGARVTTLTISAEQARLAEERLAAAGVADRERLLDSAGVRPGSRVLEIGTGWGELAIRAARRGAHVTTVTLSTEQADLARKRIADAGYADSIDLRIEDYRDVTGTYDAVVSVEMIEAVGERYWPTYFTALDRLLKPGGRVGLQSITMPHDRMLASRGDYSWMHKYVFPGGLIPSVQAIEQHLALHTTLRLAEQRSLGEHYARTLAHWRENFLSRWEAVAALGFDSTFRRMWEFYLAYCEAGFRVGYLDVFQFSLARP